MDSPRLKSLVKNLQHFLVWRLRRNLFCTCYRASEPHIICVGNHLEFPLLTFFGFSGTSFRDQSLTVWSLSRDEFNTLCALYGRPSSMEKVWESLLCLYGVNSTCCYIDYWFQKWLRPSDLIIPVFKTSGLDFKYCYV